MSRRCSRRGSWVGHAQDLVVAAGLVGHPEHADRAAGDQAAGERGRLEDDERVERVAVLAEGVLDVAVVGGVGGRGEQHAVEADPAGLVVDLVLVALTLGDLHQYVELQHVVLHHRRREEKSARPGPGIRTSLPHNDPKRAAGRSKGWPDVTDATGPGRSCAGSRCCSCCRCWWRAGAAYRFDLGAALVRHRRAGPRHGAGRGRTARRAHAARPDRTRPGGRGGRRPGHGAPAEGPQGRATPSSRTPTSGRTSSPSSARSTGGTTLRLLGRRGRRSPRPRPSCSPRRPRWRCSGPDHVFPTTVVGEGRRVVLVGGGDPLLARSAEGRRLARPRRRRHAGPRHRRRPCSEQGRTRVALGYDDSLFSGPADNPAWPGDYVPDGVVSPITALWVDEGRDANGFGRVADPSAAAAAGVRRGPDQVRDHRDRGTRAAPRAVPGAAELARVESAPLVADRRAGARRQRQRGRRGAGPARRARGRPAPARSRPATAAVLRTLQGLGVRTAGAEVYDGSGLSRENLLDPRTPWSTCSGWPRRRTSRTCAPC